MKRNIKILTTFTGTKSEEHFYLISLLIELHGASALRLMATSLDELFVNDALAHQRISENLAQLSDILDDLSEIFGNMRTDCAPEVFYGLIRHWFNGGAWTLDLGLQQEPHRQDYGGPSAGQSTLIHALDVFLGVDHRPKGASDAADSTAFDDTFMQRMATYMPQYVSHCYATLILNAAYLTTLLQPPPTLPPSSLITDTHSSLHSPQCSPKAGLWRRLFFGRS